MLKITKNQGSIQVTADKSGFYPFDGTLTFPTNSLFTATSANTDMITFKSTSNGDVQFVGNYKDITISGRSYDTKQKFLTAFSNLANQGSVDAYTKAETDAKLNDKLTAKTNAKYALFISSYSNDNASSSLALYDSSVQGTNDVAIGLASTPDKNGANNLAILNQANANGSQNIAIGDQRRCDGSANVGIGCGKYNTTDVNGTGNVCIGYSSQAHTLDNTAVNESIAIGSNATASSNYCTVVGNSAHSKSSHAVAVGDSAYVDHDSDSSVAVGSSARAYGKGSVAIGTVSYATNDKPLDICCGQRTDGTPLNVIQSDTNGKISLLKGDGTDTRMVIQDEIEALKNAGGGGTVDGLVLDGYKVAVGLYQTSFTNRNSVVIGNNVEAYNDYSVLIGDRVKGRCDDAVVIGTRAESTTNSADSSVVIGADAKSSAEYGLSIGRYAEADKTTPLVINAGVNGNSMRLTMIKGDANGKISLLKGDGTNERMVIQDEIAALKNAGGGGSVDAYTKAETDTKLDAKQDKLTAGSGITITKDETAGTNTIATAVSLTDNGNGAYKVGDSIEIGGQSSVRIGNNTSALRGQNSIIIGDSAVANNKNSIAIGDRAVANDEKCILIGCNTNTYAYATNCTVIGDHAQSASSYSTVIGASARSNAGNAVAVGSNTYIDTNGSYAVAVGSNTKAHGRNSVAIGYSSEATIDNPLVINAGYKTVDGNNKALTVLQSDSTGKLSILKGDGTDERIVIQDALSAGGSGTVDAYTKTETDALLNAKQNTLTAGNGITIDENNVISSTGGSGGSANPLVVVKGTNGNATIADDVVSGIAIGESTSVTKGSGIAVGEQSKAQGRYCVSVGRLSSCIGDSTVAVGDNAKSMMGNAVAVGPSTQAISKNAVAIGMNARANNKIPLAINAGEDQNSRPLTMIQGDTNGKISILLGDGTASTMCIQDEIAALKAEIAALKGGASTGA